MPNLSISKGKGVNKRNERLERKRSASSALCRTRSPFIKLGFGPLLHYQCGWFPIL